jgi:hypothetical protein
MIPHLGQLVLRVWPVTQPVCQRALDNAVPTIHELNVNCASDKSVTVLTVIIDVLTIEQRPMQVHRGPAAKGLLDQTSNPWTRRQGRKQSSGRGALIALLLLLLLLTL